MVLAYYTSDEHFSHLTADDHPEHAMRIMAIEQELKRSKLWDDLHHGKTTPATPEDLLRAHSSGYIDELHLIQPDQGHIYVDEDTAMTPGSLHAALWSAGSCITALEGAMAGEFSHAFVATRPPGHHAERGKAMGFCFFNNIAVTALRAADKHHLQRIAVLDFDAHQGNGTIDILGNDQRFQLFSSFQHPFYPYKHYEQGRFSNLVNVPLEEGTGSASFRAAIETRWWPALEAYAPELILVSAGFDGHKEDPMAELNLTDEDYGWLGRHIAQIAAKRNTPVISMLEGGYQLNALARSVRAYLLGLKNP